MTNILKKYKKEISTVGLIYVTIVWGSTFVVVKESLNGINPIVMVGYRFALAALILISYSIYMKKNIFQNLKDGIVLGICMCGMYITQSVGLNYTKASNSGFITGMYILFVPFFCLIILKKKIEKIRIVSSGLSIFGMYFLTGGIERVNKGDILTLFSALFCAIHILAADYYMKKDRDIFVITFQQFAVTSILSFAVSLFMGYDFSSGNIKTLESIIYLALFPTISAFVIQMYFQKFVSPFKVAAIFALEPIFALIMAVWFGNENITINTLFGGVFIIAGIVFSEIKLREGV